MMRLTQAQLAQYECDGFLVFPGLFSPEEVAILRREAARVAMVETDAVVREGKVQAPKSLFRLHETDGPTASEAFRAACRLPKALGVAQQVLGDERLYLHHSKVNVKTAIEGSVWPWHQDYGAWMRDGIAEPAMATYMVALDDASELNGCLYLLPGSHRLGRTEPYFDTSTAYKFWAVPPERMKEMLAECPLPVAVAGKAGMAAIFHCNLMHASGHNLSAMDRWQAYFCYNTVANHPHEVETPRPDHVRSRNWTPLKLAAEDAVLEAGLARA
ncbi:MAG: phytanoyl-CoA dioxygenase family protein [Alphaproteobacteria bacterium]